MGKIAYWKKIENKWFYKINPTLSNELDAGWKRICDTEGLEYRQAFERMQVYFNRMKKHILSIKEWK